MKYIELSKNGKKYKGKYFALVSDEDYDYLTQWEWVVAIRNHTNYAVRLEAKKTFYMHREINKTPIGMVADHIDHNGLNNQRENIRDCSVSENSKNSRKRKNKTSIYRGVSYCKKGRKWVAETQSDNRVYHIGRFKLEIDAAKAYDEKIKELHGDFANLNFK